MGSELMSFEGLDRNTQITIHSSEQPVGLSINDVLKWIEPTAPPKEALRFLLVCRSAGLNPFLSEAYLIKMGSKWGTVIAKSGYLKRAQDHEDFDGFEAGVVIQEQARDRNGNPLPMRTIGMPIELDGEIVPKGYLLIGGWAKVYRKGISRPFKVRVDFDEYYKDSPTWQQYPGTMIVKVALTHAIKDAFAIGDSYDEAEFADVRPQRSPQEASRLRSVMQAKIVSGDAPALTHEVSGPLDAGPYSGDDDPVLPIDVMDKITEYRERLKIDDHDWANILKRLKVDHVSQLSPNRAQSLVTYLQNKVYEGVLPEEDEDHEPPVLIGNHAPLDQEIQMVVDVEAVPSGDGDHQAARETEAGASQDVDPAEAQDGELVGSTRAGYSPLPTHDIEG